MRALLLLSLSALAVSAFAQKATYEATSEGKSVGTLTFTRKLTGATLSLGFIIEVKQEGVSTKLDLLTIYDAKGYPTSKVANIVSQGEKIKLVAKFSGLKANLSATIQGETKTGSMEAPTKTPLTDASVLWFFKTKPKPNASVKYQSYNPLNNTWGESTTKYIGPGTVQVNGKSVKAHQVVTTRDNGEKSTIWMDDTGMPYIVDQGGMKFVRK